MEAYYEKFSDLPKIIRVVVKGILILEWGCLFTPNLCFFKSMTNSEIDLCQFSSVQSLSHVPLFVTPWTAAHQASLSVTNSQSLLKLMSISLVMSSNHLILCRPLLLPPSIYPSIRVFSNELVLRIRWPKYLRFSFSISPSSDIQDWSPLGWTGWIFLQSKGLSRVFSNTTILWCSAFFIVQLSHPYMTTGKTITLTRWTFVGKVMSLLFNMLSRLVVAFLPRNSAFWFHGCSHHLQWFWSPPPLKIKCLTVSIISPIYLK